MIHKRYYKNDLQPQNNSVNATLLAKLIVRMLAQVWNKHICLWNQQRVVKVEPDNLAWIFSSPSTAIPDAKKM